MNYPILLFDLDQTLLDTDENAERALKKLTLPKDFSFTKEKLSYWHLFNAELWQKLEVGELSHETLLNTRFTHYFSQFGISVDGKKMREEYEPLFASEHQLIPGATKIVTELSKRGHRLYAISNGTKEKQYQQLEKSHLKSYFSDIFLSEDIGFQKPSKKFFQAVEKKIADYDPDLTMVIGDSLSADIQGAGNADLPSIWFNRKNVEWVPPFMPTYTVQHLEDILELV